MNPTRLSSSSSRRATLRMAGRQSVLLFLIMAANVAGSRQAMAAPELTAPFRAATALRRPVALARLGPALYIGNRETGSVSIFDLNSLSVIGEHPVSRRLDDLVAVPRSQSLVAVDSKSHELLQIVVDNDSLRIAHRTSVAKFPASVVVLPGSRQACVASRWSRRASIVAVDPAGTKPPQVTKTIDLPFAPGKQLVLDERHVLVADAFEGQLAIVDMDAGRIRSRRKLNGHNIRGLTLTDDRKHVKLTHQIMLSITATTRSRISWGGVVSNSLQTIPVRQFLTEKTSAETNAAQTIYGRMYPLGEDRYAAGDPSGVASARDGRTFVALSGVHEISLKRKDALDLARSRTGRRPTELHFDEASNQLFVLNTFDDSVSVVDGESLEELRRIPLGTGGGADCVTAGRGAVL